MNSVLKKIVNIVTAGLLAISMVFVTTVSVAQPAYADDKASILTDCASKADSDDGSAIFCILNIGLTILTYGVGIAGTIGIIISGIMYLTARDNEQQLTKAKSRILNIVIGLAIYAVMWAFLQWVLPGGVL